MNPADKRDVLARFQRSLLDEDLAVTTVSNHVGAARRWWLYCGGRPFDPDYATSKLVRAFLADLEADTPSAVRNTAGSLRRFYRFAAAYGLAHHDPAAAITVTARPPRRQQSHRAKVLGDWTAAMRRRGLASGTIEKRIPLIRRWWEFCEDPFAADVDWRTVERFVDATEQFSVNARYATVSHLHRFYVWARRNQLTDQDPTELVERPRTARNLPRPISDSDLALAVALADTTMRAALMLAAGGGLRCCELARLRWDDVASDSVRVLGKGSKERVIPLHPAARAALDELDRDDVYVFPWRSTARTGEYAAGVTASQTINRYLHTIGISATAHTLRHYAATKALRASGDLRAVQELLGHASPATTAIYTRVVVDHLVDVVNGIELPTPEPNPRYSEARVDQITEHVNRMITACAMRDPDRFPPPDVDELGPISDDEIAAILAGVLDTITGMLEPSDPILTDWRQQLLELGQRPDVLDLGLRLVDEFAVAGAEEAITTAHTADEAQIVSARGALFILAGMLGRRHLDSVASSG